MSDSRAPQFPEPAQAAAARTEVIQVHVNGERIESAAGLNLPEFLSQRALNPRLVAVEYNGEILHRQFWETTIIEAGDRLEIVTIVGGGR